MLQKKYNKLLIFFILFILNYNQIQAGSRYNQSQKNPDQQSQSQQNQNQNPIYFKASFTKNNNLILYEYLGILIYNPVQFSGYTGAIYFSTNDQRMLNSTLETALTSFTEMKENNLIIIFAKNYAYFVSTTDDSFKNYLYFDDVNGDSAIFLPLDSQYCFIIYIN